MFLSILGLDSALKTLDIKRYSILLSRIIKPFFSILQRRPRIYKEFFMLVRIIRIFILSIPKGRPSIFKEVF